MDKKQLSSHPEVEQKLEQLLGSMRADAGFVERLEGELITRRSTRARQPVHHSLRFVWTALAAAALLLVTLLALMGPERVLAETRRLLGYLPGIGFADPERTRVLTEPVEVTRDGVTVRIEQVVADAQQTLIRFHISGLPADRPEVTDSIHYSLVLPDGSDKWEWGYQLSSKEHEVSGQLEYRSLPPGTEAVTVVWPRLPGIAPGVAPENWVIPLRLTIENRAVRSYQPDGAQVMVNGMIVTVAEAAYSTEETGLKLHMDWSESDGQFRGMTIQLSDETGRDYNLIERQQYITPAALERSSTEMLEMANVLERTYRFTPFAPDARQAVLNVTHSYWTYPGHGSFTIDFGPNPQVGQSVTFDPAQAPVFEKSGARFTVLGGRLEAAPTDQPSSGADHRLVLQLRVEMTNGVVEAWPSFVARGLGPEGYSATALENNQTEMTVSLYQLPTAPVTVDWLETFIQLEGPWTVVWDLR